MFIIVYWPLDSPSEFLEPIEHRQLKEHINAKDDILRLFRIPLSGEEAMIEDMSEHEDGEIQSRKVVVNVGDATHDEERNKVEKPSEERNLSNVEKMIPFTGFHINIFPLLPE